MNLPDIRQCESGTLTNAITRFKIATMNEPIEAGDGFLQNNGENHDNNNPSTKALAQVTNNRWPFPISPDDEGFGTLDFSQWNLHDPDDEMGGDLTPYEVLCRNLERLGASLITVGHELVLADHPGTARPETLVQAILHLQYLAVSMPQRLKKISEDAVKFAPSDVFAAREYVEFAISRVSRE